jgi:hypothetical protein
MALQVTTGSGMPHSAAAKAQSKAGVAFAFFARDMTDFLCRF